MFVLPPALRDIFHIPINQSVNQSTNQSMLLFQKQDHNTQIDRETEKKQRKLP